MRSKRFLGAWEDGSRKRERRSDASAEPLVWYVYILELEDGDFYVGQTNDLKVRLAEHAMGAGAGHTKGMKPRLVWVNMATERESAKLMEARLQRAKERNYGWDGCLFQGLVNLADGGHLERMAHVVERERRS